MVAHRAADFKEAEKWDLEFWQNQTPEQRLTDHAQHVGSKGKGRVIAGPAF